MELQSLAKVSKLANASGAGHPSIDQRRSLDKVDRSFDRCVPCKPQLGVLRKKVLRTTAIDERRGFGGDI